MELRSDYRVLENNCQHFAKALVRDITGKDFGSRMIAEALKPYIDFVDNARSLVRLRTYSVQLSPTKEKPFFNFSCTIRWFDWLLTGRLTGSIMSRPRRASDEGIVPIVSEVNIQPQSPTSRSILLQWAGLQTMLHQTERRYLDELHLGEPKLVEEFNVYDEGSSGGISTCVLFPKVLLLFREQHESTHLHFERGTSVHYVDHTAPPKWSVYAIIFPRHVNQVVPKPNGIEACLAWAYGGVVGFELSECPGLWLGLERASATLNLRFEITSHSCEVPSIWVTHLQIFGETEYDREYTSIFDRLPLDKVVAPPLLPIHDQS